MLVLPGGRGGGSRPREAADGDADPKPQERSLGLPQLPAESPWQRSQLDSHQQSETKADHHAQAEATVPELG